MLRARRLPKNFCIGDVIHTHVDSNVYNPELYAHNHELYDTHETLITIVSKCDFYSYKCIMWFTLEKGPILFWGKDYYDVY